MFVVLAVMLALAQQRPAHAGIINGSVSLDTSGLSGTFEIGFILIDGSGTGDANNTVMLGNFGFGGGSVGTVDLGMTTPGASGDFASGATLIDSGFFVEFAQGFTAGAQLTFDFGLTTNLDAGVTPDQFSIALFQSDGTPIPSLDPSGAVLLVNIDSTQPTFQSFATDVTAAPVVTTAGTAPEPSTVALFAMALTGAVWSTRRTPRRRAVER